MMNVYIRLLFFSRCRCHLLAIGIIHLDIGLLATSHHFVVFTNNRIRLEFTKFGNRVGHNCKARQRHYKGVGPAPGADWLLVSSP